ncbi:MAG: phage tail family protein [Candidatus Pacebacteria bacterium]|nr:phage tail family protein [Candidatus Paceibacterota bacterium]
MPSIKFDGTEILNTTYIPRFIKHESATEIIMVMQDINRENGSALVSIRRGIKRIPLRGILTAASQSALETAIDSFKELFSRQEKNLDIEWAGSTRRYVATCSAGPNFDRDYFHKLFVPWTAEFLVVSGVGEDTSETTIVNADTFSANYKTKAIALTGSAEPRIRFSIGIISTNGTIKGVELKNTDNGDRIVVPSNASLNGKTIEVDTRLKTVKIDAVESPYYGLFPRFIVGTNNIMISCGDIIDQQFAPATDKSAYSIYGSYKSCQGFKVPYSNTTYKSFWLRMSYSGDPSVGCDVRIETDNGGEASGNLVNANAKGAISKPEMSGGLPTWYQVFLDAEISLEANTQYWIVLQPHAPGLDVSNCYNWYYESDEQATYKLGVAGFYDGGWTLDADKDMKFKLCFGGTYDATFTQTYSIYQTKRYI